MWWPQMLPDGPSVIACLSVPQSHSLPALGIKPPLTSQFLLVAKKSTTILYPSSAGLWLIQLAKLLIWKGRLVDIL